MISDTGPKKRKRAGKQTGGGSKQSKMGTVVEGYQYIDTTHTKTEYKTFAGMEFCVLTVGAPHTKEEVAVEIKRHGGSITANYSGKTSFLVAESAGHVKVREPALLCSLCGLTAALPYCCTILQLHFLCTVALQR